MRLKKLFILILGVSLFGCMNQYAPVPSDVIDSEKFTDIVVDIRLAEAQQKVYRHKGFFDSDLLDSSYQMIYTVHDVSEEQVVRSYNFYVQHPNWMDKIAEDAIEKLNRMLE